MQVFGSYIFSLAERCKACRVQNLSLPQIRDGLRLTGSHAEELDSLELETHARRNRDVCQIKKENVNQSVRIFNLRGADK